MKRWLFRIMALLMVMIICLGVGETALRIIKPKSLYTSARIIPPMYLADYELGWKLIPGFDGKLRTAEFDTRLHINRSGFRDRGFTSGDSSVFKILGLGDSFTFGFGVNAEDTYLYRLETLMRTGTPDASPRACRIYNTGVPGYSIREEYLVYKRMMPTLRPDLVTIGFDVNDHTDCSNARPKYQVVDGYILSARSAARARTAASSPPSYSVFLHRHSYLYSLLSMAKKTITTSLAGSDKRSGAQTVPTVSFDPDKKKTGLSCAEAYLDSICALSRSAGIKVVLVFIPHRSQIYPLHPENRLTEQKYFDDLDRFLEEYCRRKGVVFINLLPLMRQAAAADSILYYMTTDAHWNTAGHKLAAEAMYKVLTERFPEYRR